MCPIGRAQVDVECCGLINRNLKLKKGALDKFKLPVDVIEGSIGNLVLQVP